MAKKLSNEEFVNKLLYNLGEEYEPLEEYLNSNTKIRMLHKTCNHVYSVKPKEVTKTKNPTKCPKCFGSHAKTEKEVYDEILCKYDGLYELEMTNPESKLGNKKDITVMCRKCGNSFITKPYRILSNGNGCSYCYGNRKLSLDEINIKINEKFGDKIEILEGSGTSNLKIKIKDCGHVYDNVNLYNLMNIKKCKICNNKYKKNVEDLSEELKNTGLGEYKVVRMIDSKVNGNVEFKHLICGNNFKCNFYTLSKRNKRCPYCEKSNLSFPEKIIKENLSGMKIPFDEQVTFDWLKLNKFKPMSIDFYLRDIDMYLEYDGEFHFLKMYSSQDLEISKTRDRYKNDGMIERELNFIRIPYTYKNKIADILDLIYRSEYDSILKSFPKVFLSLKGKSNTNSEKYFDENGGNSQSSR